MRIKRRQEKSFSQDLSRVIVALACGIGLAAVASGCSAVDVDASTARDGLSIRASDNGSAAIAAPLSDGSNCCVEADPLFPRAGCSVASIAECVCSELPECCADNWGLQCVGAASSICGGCSFLSADERAVVALLIDSDGDGLLDIEEIAAGMNPYDPSDGPDIDGDGIDNGDDPDVDGDGELNAYDDDVDGDGIDNVDDDDIDGDGLLNDLFDDDDDGDGISNLIDNDDDANGLPDPDDEAVVRAAEDDDDDDPDKCSEPEGDELLQCVLKVLLEIEDDKVSFIADARLDRLRELLEPIEGIAEEALNALCDSDDDCGLDERCTWGTCTEDVECVPSNDIDGDGLCEGDDINANGDRFLDDDRNGVPDFLQGDMGPALPEGEEDVDAGTDAANPDEIEEESGGDEGQEGQITGNDLIPDDEDDEPDAGDNGDP